MDWELRGGPQQLRLSEGVAGDADVYGVRCGDRGRVWGGGQPLPEPARAAGRVSADGHLAAMGDPGRDGRDHLEMDFQWKLRGAECAAGDPGPGPLVRLLVWQPHPCAADACDRSRLEMGAAGGHYVSGHPAGHPSRALRIRPHRWRKRLGGVSVRHAAVSPPHAVDSGDSGDSGRIRDLRSRLCDDRWRTRRRHLTPLLVCVRGDLSVSRPGQRGRTRVCDRGGHSRPIAGLCAAAAFGGAVHMIRRGLAGGGMTAVGLALALFILGPILWMLDTSVQLDRDLFTVPPRVIPVQPTLDNYRYVITRMPPKSYERVTMGGRVSGEALSILPALKNSFIVASSVTVVVLVVGAVAAYTYARVRFVGRDLTYAFILTSRLIPAISVAIPVFVIIDRLKLLDTYWVLILVYVAFILPFTIWFLTHYFGYLPRDIEEAALLDGCTRFGTLRRVVVPVVAPGLAAAAAFAFMSAYSEFLYALFLTRTIAAKTAPVILVATAINFDVSFALASAALILTIVPPIVFALVFRRFITRGMLVGFGR